MVTIKPKENLGPFYGGGVSPNYWTEELKGLLKAELARKRMKYPDLVKRLARVGVTESEPNLRNKISRGNFSATFFLQCLMAVGVTDLRLPKFPYPPGQDPDQEAAQAWLDDDDRPSSGTDRFEQPEKRKPEDR